MNEEIYNKNKEMLDKIKKKLSTMDIIAIREILNLHQDNLLIRFYCERELRHREFIAENN
jgi:DNA-binding transcriptional regulator YiaG